MAYPIPLSGNIKGSFAYETIKDRLPIILTRIIDLLCREKTSITCKFCEGKPDALKGCVGQLSKLKNEMQTNKALLPLCDESLKYNLFDHYDRFLEEYQAINSVPAHWFTTSWLFAECYMYARIHKILNKSSFLSGFDPFQHQKEISLKTSTEAIQEISCYIQNLLPNINQVPMEKLRLIVYNMTQASLWGNQKDLSLSAGKVDVSGITLQDFKKREEKILVNNFDLFWEAITHSNEDTCFGFILDNAGLELFADLCFVTLLMESKLCKSVTFYVKTIPWFVSDTMEADFYYMLEYTSTHTDAFGFLANKWRQYLSVGTWKIRNHVFWTTHHPYYIMESVSPELYKELKENNLLIFKGDLNYRKLTGDLDWPHNTSFKDALQGFLPTSMLVLRTIKGGPVVGIDEKGEKILSNAPSSWNISGNFGMIHFL